MFHRSDLLARHEDRHAARMAKKQASEEPHSPIKIAPSPPLARSPQNSPPYGSPPRSPNRSPPLMSPDIKPLISELHHRFGHASMTMPASTPNNLLSSPSSENGYNERSDEPWSAGEQPMDIDPVPYGASSSPEYARPTPMHPLYNEQPQSLPFVSPLLSASSPMYPHGFAAINQVQGYASSAQTIVDQSHMFPNSGPMDIPQSYGIQAPLPVLSPPLEENTGIFAFTENSLMLDMQHQQHHQNWDTIWQSDANVNSYSWMEQHAASLDHYTEMQQSFPAAEGHGEGRRGSVYYSGVPSHHDRDYLPKGCSCWSTSQRWFRSVSEYPVHHK